MKPRFFRSREELEAWLDANHARATELVVGLYKRGADRSGITYRELVDAVLAFGWIDGVRRTLDDERWTIRITPRKARSIWSRVNVARVAELEAEGRMREPGRKAFAARDEARTGVYSFESAPRTLEPAAEKKLRADRAAWRFFEAQPPSYKRTAVHWVTSAKKEETRARRLETLITCSRESRRIPPLVYDAAKYRTKERA